MVKGNLHHFSAGGLYNGLVLLIDDETGTYWDHITGKAVHGKLAGAKLDSWSIEHTNASAILAREPNLRIQISKPSWRGRAAGLLSRNIMRSRGIFPPGFRRTMANADTRLPEMTHGLGVVLDGEARFYPMTVIASGTNDQWGERILRVKIDATDGVPGARWADGSRPFQLFCRWYGFSYTYPTCSIVGQSQTDSPAASA